MKRILPLTHSEGYSDVPLVEGGTPEIICIPFALNPEGHNPSGHINFSKISYASLELKLGGGSAYTDTTCGDIYVDVWAPYYNWTQIKDGRIVNSFQ